MCIENVNATLTDTDGGVQYPASLDGAYGYVMILGMLDHMRSEGGIAVVTDLAMLVGAVEKWFGDGLGQGMTLAPRWGLGANSFFVKNLLAENQIRGGRMVSAVLTNIAVGPWRQSPQNLVECRTGSARCAFTLTNIIGQQ